MPISDNPILCCTLFSLFLTFFLSAIAAKRHRSRAIELTWWSCHAEVIKKYYYDTNWKLFLWLGLIKSGRLPHRFIQEVLVFGWVWIKFSGPSNSKRKWLLWGLVKLLQISHLEFNFRIESCFHLYVVSVIWHICARTHTLLSPWQDATSKRATLREL